jgi:tRNA (guanine26-N2/guanine27-N2)-dimethyltransferase
MYARTRNALLLLLGRRRRRFEKKKKNTFFQLTTTTTTTTTDEKALFLTTTTRENERFAIFDLLPPPTSRRNTCASLAEETRTKTTVSAMKEDKGRETERNDGVFSTKRPTLPPPPGFDEVVVEGQGKVLQRENEVFYNRPQVVNRDLSLAMIREFQKRRKEEYENETYQKTRRGKGMYNKVPKESKIIEYLVSEEERERMFASKKEVPKSENDAKKDDGTKQKEWIEVKPGTFRWQVAGEEVKETIPKPTKVEEKKKEEEEIEIKTEKTPLEPITILEGMCATGLRAIRYARELDDVKCIVANDLDPTAALAVENNKRYNALESEEVKARVDKIVTNCGDVRVVALQHEKCFDVVDLDPYGTPSQQLESAVLAPVEGGLLCVTATDMSVLCGNNGEVGWTKYASYPLKAKYCHEQSTRILLAAIQSAAVKNRRYIVPVLSTQIDFYARVYVRVYSSAVNCKSAASNLSYVFQCVGCDSFELQPLGRLEEKSHERTGKTYTRFMPGKLSATVEHNEHGDRKCHNCGWGMNVGGPIWSAPVHDKQWVESVLKDVKESSDERYPGKEKVRALLTNCSEELSDSPLHYCLHSMAGTLKITPPTLALFRSAIINAGYKVSGVHCNQLAVKTNAPSNVLWDIMKCWEKEHPAQEDFKNSKSPGASILKKEPIVQAKWTRVHGAFSKAQMAGETRFPTNPEENWGPKNRATGGRSNKREIASCTAPNTKNHRKQAKKK